MNALWENGKFMAQSIQHVKLVMAVASILVVILFMVAYSSPHKPNATSLLQKQALSADGFVMKMEGWDSTHLPEEVLPHVDVVVIATITGVSEAKWNTPDGKRPPDWTIANFSEARIYTPYQFRIEKTIRGTLKAGDESNFVVIGGTVGPDTMDANNSAAIYQDIKVGDKALLMLKATRDSMTYAGPYAYGEAYRLDGDKAVAGCKSDKSCRATINLGEILRKTVEIPQVVQ